MKYFRPLLAIVSFLTVLLMILGIEQVFGGPIIFLALASLWLEKRTAWVQLIATVLLASTVATVYLVAFSLSFITMYSCLILFGQLRLKLASQTGALLIASLIGGLAFSILSHTSWSWPWLISTGLSLGVVIGVSKITLTQPSKRYHL